MIDTFIARYTPAVATQIHGARGKLRKKFPRGYELVYDNYNALVFAFGPTQKVSDLVLSIAAYPKWVSLFFARGKSLPDPHGLLQGKGSQIRHVVLTSPRDLESPPLRALIAHAMKAQAKAFPSAPKLITEIRSISARQRPRRPTSTAPSSPRG